MARRRRGVKFTDKKKSVQARISILLSCVSATWLGYSVWHTCHHTLASGYHVGAFGMLMMIVQVVAIIRAYRSTKEEDVFPTTPRMALVLAILLMLVWLLLYGLGWYTIIME